MLRYKKKKSQITLNRQKWATQGLSMVLHLLLIAIFFQQTATTAVLPKAARITVELKEQTQLSEVKQSSKQKSVGKKSAKTDKPTLSKRKKSGLLTGKPIVAAVAVKRKKGSYQSTWNPDSRRLDRKSSLRKLEVVDQLTTRSESSNRQAMVAEVTVDEKNRQLAETKFEMPQGQRRVSTFSEKLSIDDIDEKRENNVEKQMGERLQIALLEDSSYSVMPEFLWGTPTIDYPLWARKSGSEGRIELLIRIMESGEVGSVNLAKTPLDPKLGDLIQQEAMAWRFKPMVVDGKPLTGTVSVKVSYRLEVQQAVNQAKVSTQL